MGTSRMILLGTCVISCLNKEKMSKVWLGDERVQGGVNFVSTLVYQATLELVLNPHKF